jgi:hypothetical protein
MDNGIWATWYDMAEENRHAFNDWLHGQYLPELMRKPGVAWAAHYQITGGGDRMQEIHDRLVHAEEEELGNGSQFLVLAGATSPHVFADPRIDEWEAGLDDASAAMLAHRIGTRSSIFTQEEFVTGPEFGARVTGGTPGPAIQMGSFRTRTVADEFDLMAWYAQYRLPNMSRMPGCIATRKLVSVAGWANHCVMYEFLSLDARQEHFQNHESLALDDGEWTNKIITYTIHAPGSPSVGKRLWPPVDD